MLCVPHSYRMMIIKFRQQKKNHNKTTKNHKTYSYDNIQDCLYTQKKRAKEEA